MKAMRQSRAPGVSHRVRGTRPVRMREGPPRRRVRLVTWRRRHLNGRTVVAVIALSSLLAPGAAAIIDATM